MARQKGIIKLDGTIGDITFYKSKDGSLAREKGGVDGARIANDAAFKRTRENGAEFGSAAKAGKLVRDSIRPLLASAKDAKMIARLTTIMTKIKSMDAVSARGERNVNVGLQTAPAKNLLRGFNFNIQAILKAMINKPIVLNTTVGTFGIANLEPLRDIVYPAGATHFNLFGAWAKIDFSTGDFAVELTNVSNYPIDNTLSNVLLAVPVPPAGAGFDFYFMGVEFFQEVNGLQYPLRNGAFNALSILEII